MISESSEQQNQTTLHETRSQIRTNTHIATGFYTENKINGKQKKNGDKVAPARTT